MARPDSQILSIQIVLLSNGYRRPVQSPVTCGMDQVTCVLANGFAAMIDIPGLNYRTQRYKESYDQLPQNLILGSETASTVSSRGVYKFPDSQILSIQIVRLSNGYRRPVCLKTAIICIAVYGTRMRKPCIFCLTGQGRDVKAK